MSFTQIGILIGFREISVNLLEIPSGAIADIFGRRRSMVYSMLSYIVSFLIFAFAESYWQFFVAMAFYAGGDAFRTGTHKAIILDWLRTEGREDERTKTYGYTRSWSKLGSTIMAPLAAVIALLSGNYSRIFLFSLIPYVINIVNLATYPAYLDGVRHDKKTVSGVAGHLWESAKIIFGRSKLRRVLLESMTYQGLYASLKDYIQPVIKTAAVSLPLFAAWNSDTRTKILTGGVYFLLGLFEAVSSRQAHKVSNFAGGEERAARALWWTTFAFYAMMTLVCLLCWEFGMIAGFIFLAALMNFWRPISVSRIDKNSDKEFGATVLSVDSQTKSVFTMIAAPVAGMLVDYVKAGGEEARFWPVAFMGLVVTGIVIILSSGKSRPVQRETKEQIEQAV